MANPALYGHRKKRVSSILLVRPATLSELSLGERPLCLTKHEIEFCDLFSLQQNRDSGNVMWRILAQGPLWCRYSIIRNLKN